jgi:NAD+--asparagine ADP-ribosyltransferase
MGNYIKKLKQRDKEYAKKLKKYNKAIDRILLSDSRNKNYIINKNNKIKDESDKKINIIYTSFESNKRRH